MVGLGTLRRKKLPLHAMRQSQLLLERATSQVRGEDEAPVPRGRHQQGQRRRDANGEIALQGEERFGSPAEEERNLDQLESTGPAEGCTLVRSASSDRSWNRKGRTAASAFPRGVATTLTTFLRRSSSTS